MFNPDPAGEGTGALKGFWMASANYKDKDLEEVKTLLLAYSENYKAQFAETPDKARLLCDLSDLLFKKKEAFFIQHFCDLSAKNLIDCCELINEGHLSPKPQTLETKSKKNNKGK